MLGVLGVWSVVCATSAFEIKNEVQVNTTPVATGNPPVGGEKAFADGKLYYNAMPSTPAQGTALKVIDSTDDKDYVMKTYKLDNTGIVYEIRDFLYGPLELEGAKVATSKDVVTEDEYLVVTAPEFMFPWVEATIRTLDKPGTSYEYSGSSRIWYTCQNRKASELQVAIEKTLGTKYGELVVDDTINHIMYKDAPTITARVAKWLPYFDIAPEMVRIEAQIVEINVGNDFNFGLALEAWKEGLPENVDMKMDMAETRNSQQSSEIYQDMTTPYKITQKPFNSKMQYLAGGLTAQGMRPKAVANMINYMVRTGNAKVLCTPTVVALNGRLATIASIDKIDYKAYTAPTQPLQKQVGSGITLTITPTIAAESMQLQILATVDSLVGYTSSGEPILNSRATTAQVVLQDGELFTLSGLRKDVVTKQDERVPVLGSTPLIGYLFRHEIDVTKSSEIVVLLTPYKVTANSGVLERERQLLEDVEQAQDAPKRTGWDTFVDRVIKNKNVAEQPTVN